MFDFVSNLHKIFGCLFAGVKLSFLYVLNYVVNLMERPQIGGRDFLRLGEFVHDFWGIYSIL
jgi:hypothetical protein